MNVFLQAGAEMVLSEQLFEAKASKRLLEDQIKKMDTQVWEEERGRDYVYSWRWLVRVVQVSVMESRSRTLQTQLEASEDEASKFRDGCRLNTR